MLRFLSAHVVENLRSVGVDLPQTIGEVAVNATVLLFEKNGLGQNFALGQFAEFSRHPTIPFQATRAMLSRSGVQLAAWRGIGLSPSSVIHGMRLCRRCGSAPSHAGFCAVPSKMDEVLKGSNSPCAAALAVFDSNAVNSVSLNGRNVRAASQA